MFLFSIKCVLISNFSISLYTSGFAKALLLLSDICPQMPISSSLSGDSWPYFSKSGFRLDCNELEDLIRNLILEVARVDAGTSLWICAHIVSYRRVLRLPQSYQYGLMWIDHRTTNWLKTFISRALGKFYQHFFIQVRVNVVAEMLDNRATVTSYLLLALRTPAIILSIMDRAFITYSSTNPSKKVSEAPSFPRSVTQN